MRAILVAATLILAGCQPMGQLNLQPPSLESIEKIDIGQPPTNTYEILSTWAAAVLNLPVVHDDLVIRAVRKGWISRDPMSFSVGRSNSGTVCWRIDAKLSDTFFYEPKYDIHVFMNGLASPYETHVEKNVMQSKDYGFVIWFLNNRILAYSFRDSGDISTENRTISDIVHVYGADRQGSDAGFISPRVIQEIQDQKELIESIKNFDLEMKQGILNEILKIDEWLESNPSYIFIPSEFGSIQTKEQLLRAIKPLRSSNWDMDEEHAAVYVVNQYREERWRREKSAEKNRLRLADVDLYLYKNPDRDRFRRSIENRSVELGMNSKELILSLGSPDRRTRSTSSLGTIEVLYFGNRLVVTLHENVVQSFDEIE